MQEASAIGEAETVCRLGLWDNIRGASLCGGCECDNGTEMPQYFAGFENVGGCRVKTVEVDP